MPEYTPGSFLRGYEEQGDRIKHRALSDLQQQVTRQGLLAKLQEEQQKREYQAEIAALGPNPTQEQLVQVAAKRAGPDTTMRVHQSSLDRKAASEAAVATRQAALEQQATLAREREEARIESARERGATQQMLAQMRIDADERMRRFMVENRPEPAPRNLQLTADAEGNQLIVDADGTTRPLVGPDGKPVKKPATEKALPASAAAKLLENRQNLRRAEQALSLIEGKDVGAMKGDPNATGLKGFVPDTLLQRFDPEGTDTRAALADLGSLVIHDRSGAAVTAAEFPRLMPFIPKINDDPATVKKKLKRFAQVYREVTDDAESFYRASGFKVPESQVGSGGGGDQGDAALKAKVEASGIPYEPTKYEYRISPDGKVQRRLRGG